MAFDDKTRKRLNDFVAEARKALSDEFTRQLQNDYGMDPTSGSITSIEKLSHLDDARLDTARVLREITAHYQATMPGADVPAVLGRLVREQAFTTLNRLTALRMMEARGLLIESVANGYKSQGFQLYSRLAGGGLGELGDTYRSYLFSLFDEFAAELPTLFDRFAPLGRLFPREAALMEVLDLTNHGDIAPLLAEDETIGWIYQYFNSRDERKKMREASQTPRNSRELAVRNQFFTPRYVVEFLVDNTLGRMWYGMSQGKTALVDSCHYLMRTSKDVFLQEGRTPKEEHEIAFQVLKDPREIRLLDPACGSMHFGLYAFDLFETIYREAWHLSIPAPIVSGKTQQPLREAYPDEEAFNRDIPRLIIENNIYGVDIDPRAAQIAALALWLRAQRAWHEAGVKAKDRPTITQSNVVPAIAPPTEKALRERFKADLDYRDADIFEKTLQLLKDLPELGVLLRIERELPHLIKHVFGSHGPMFLEGDEEVWRGAETRLRAALDEFAHSAQSGIQARMFAHDALQGLRLIDLTNLKYDVVVMNPPFGLASKEKFEHLKASYPDAYVDLYACFISRAIELCNGWVGSITSRSLLVTKKLERLRTNWVVPRLECLLDLGWPVMDDATVQSAAYTLNCTVSGPSSAICAIDRKPYLNKSENLMPIGGNRENITDSFVLEREAVNKMPKAKILYNLPSSAMQLFLEPHRLGGEVIIAKQGMKSFNDFRFLRARHEVLPLKIGKGREWVPLAKGGAYAVFYSDLPLLVNWQNDGQQVCEVNRLVNGQTAQARQASVHYYKRGGTYSRRCKDFGVRVLPADFIIGEKGPAILPIEGHEPSFVVGLLNARLFRALINLQANAKQYDTGIIESCPFIPLSKEKQIAIQNVVTDVVNRLREYSQRTEGDSLFVCPEIRGTFVEMAQLAEARAREIGEVIVSSLAAIDDLVDSTYQIDSKSIENVVLAEKSSDDDSDGEEESESDEQLLESTGVGAELVSYSVGCALGRWDIRYATGQLPVPKLGDLFDALPPSIPGMLKWDSESWSKTNYPVPLPESSVLVDDEGNSFDIVKQVQDVLGHIWRDQAGDIEQNIVANLSAESLRNYLRKPSGFFASHLALYTRSKRKAPIYWPLSTTSGSYTLWLYYPSLNSQSLYSALNDFLEPKLHEVAKTITVLRDKGATRNGNENKELNSLPDLELELIELRNTLQELAPTYHPCHDDGVQISAAPLWSLFRHKPWQKVLKDTWEKLNKGDYDWAHLAMNYWPERVREKCKTDKSLAIAHGLEELYVEPVASDKPKRSRKTKET